MSRLSPLPPFQRGPFDALPAVPVRAHGFFEIPSREIRVASRTMGDVVTHYRELGNGPALLLVHGLMTTSYSFRYVMHELARDYRVIALDLPGCGRSGKPLVHYGADALATFLIEFTRALGVRGCRVVGNSMGGYLCMQASLGDAGVFSRMVNIHSPGVPDVRYRVLHAALSLPGSHALLARIVRIAPLRWAHANVHYNDESLKSLEEAHEYGDPLAAPDGAETFIRYLQDTFAPRDLTHFVATLARRRREKKLFPTPLMLLYSRQDPLVPPAVGEKLHRLVPEAELRWIDDSSHFAHVDTPAEVLHAIRPFLAGD